MFDLDLEVIGSVDEARATSKRRTKRAANDNKKKNETPAASKKRRAKAKSRRLMTSRGRKISKALRGKPKKAAHKKAISLSMKKYWRSKRAAHRRRKGGKKKATGKRGTKKAAGAKPRVRVKAGRK